jgi:mono/diheme cytochrome c family protein
MCISRSAFAFTIAFALFGHTHACQASSDTATREDFLGLCADCHGADAKGGGPLAKNLSKVPPDLTRIKERGNGKFNEKAVFDWIIGLDTPNFHGTREMPIWGDWLMDETLKGGTSLEAAHAAEKEIERRVMALVKYLEAMQVGR